MSIPNANGYCYEHCGSDVVNWEALTLCDFGNDFPNLVGKISTGKEESENDSSNFFSLVKENSGMMVCSFMPQHYLIDLGLT